MNTIFVKVNTNDRKVTTIEERITHDQSADSRKKQHPRKHRCKDLFRQNTQPHSHHSCIYGEGNGMLRCRSLNDKDDSASAATSPEHTEIRVPDGGGESAAAEGTEALADSELNRFASFVRDSLLSEDTAPHESIYEDMIQLYKDEIRKKDVWISRLFWCLAGIMMFILFVLVFDILNPTFGFVMY